MQQKAMSKIYFPNLNGLRFITASIVIMHHVEQFKEFLGFPNYAHVSFIKLIGKAGVALFFVLSGYLITYLLLVETRDKGEIAIGRFYIRRALRIWPLYFFIILLSFFILPHLPFLHIPELTGHVHEHFWTKLLLYVLFLPNLVLAIYPIVPFASQLWSIGYEEQFYLVWPWLIKKIKNKYLIFFSIIAFFIIIKFLALFVFDDYLLAHHYDKAAEIFFMMPSIDGMAIGGLFAYLLFQRHPILEWFYSKTFQWVLYALTFGLIFGGVFIPFFNNQAYSFLFGLIILNLSANPKTIFSLENKTMDYLGKISYGIYMYHILMVVTVLKLLAMFDIHNVVLENILAISFTVVAAGISYKYLEERFIKMKSKKFHP